MDKIIINSNRLQWCCDTLDFDIYHLSKEINIANQTLERAMDNEAVLSIKQLQKIAVFFNRSLLFFLDSNAVKEEKIYSPQFRTINNQKYTLSPKLRALLERIEGQRKIYLDLLEDLGESINSNWYPHQLPLTHNSIKKVAAETREWLELKGENSFEDLRQAVENKGVMVFVTNGYNGKWQIAKNNPVRGFSFYYDILPIIVIKKQFSKGTQAFTLMHELAHLLLHKESAIDEKNDFFSYQGKEKKANEFAGNVLIPDDFLSQIDLDELTRLKIEEYDNYLKYFKNRWCVSGEVILIRLLRNNKISQVSYDNYRKLKKLKTIQTGKGSRAYRFREPIHMFGRSFVNTVLDSLHSKKITLSKASTFLDNIKISDIHKLEGRNV